jgi:hypothetical protein
MEKLNRDLQLRMLKRLADSYPQEVTPDALNKALGLDPKDFALLVNAAYLGEHGLLEAKIQSPLSGAPFLLRASITARGLDFLQDDGGLGAILNVVTVRFEADTLRALIAAKVDASPLPAEEKGRIKKLLAELGTEGLKTATQKLVEAGLERWPEALQWLQTLSS